MTKKYKSFVDLFIFKTYIYIYVFLQTVAMSVLLYGWTTWTLTKPIEKKLDGNYGQMIWVIFNNSWKHDHLLPITKTIQGEQDMWDNAEEAMTNP